MTILGVLISVEMLGEELGRLGWLFPKQFLQFVHLYLFFVHSGIQNPFIVFILCIIIGVALYLVGYGCWKVLVLYIKAVSNTKQRLSL